MGARATTLVIAAVVAIAAVGSARADRLAPEELAKKNEGGYVTGLPLFAYSTDIGLGLGARVYYFWNGHRSDARFGQTPYLYRMFLQGFASSRGTQFHWLDFDAPKIFESSYRVRSQLIFQRNLNSNYFGLGGQALDPLRYPGSPTGYDSYSDYTHAQQQIATDGTVYTKYDQFDLLRPVFVASLERSFASDRVRVLGGLGFSYARIRTYDGKTVDGTDASGATVDAIQTSTRLGEDCASGALVGCGGGRDNFVRLGISYDTRDYEPDPNTGVFLDLAVDVGTVALGSEYDYLRGIAAARGYWSPIPSHADLVLAGRVMLEAQTKGTPFFSMNVLPFTEDPRNGLGGHRTLRGYRQDRFVGSVMSMLNAEARWTWGHLTIKRQRFAFMLVPFFDIGRPFDELSDLTFRRWRASYGGAVRIAWNLATIVTVDYGRSSEDAGFYINFNHIF